MEFLIDNVEVFGIGNSVIASGYPMKAETRYSGYKQSRADKLADNSPGTGHNNFLKGIIIQADITASIKWWVQQERYSFADIISSQSTMHKLKDMNLDKTYIDYVDDRVIEVMKGLQEQYNENPTKENFYKLIYTNPDGLMLTARITTNYLQEKTIYNQRRTHKLDEWQKYCDWLETLPNSHWITNNGDKQHADKGD